MNKRIISLQFFVSKFYAKVPTACPFYVPISQRSYTRCCIKEFIKRKLSSGLFWAVGAAEKKKPPNYHKYATFLGGFFNF